MIPLVRTSIFFGRFYCRGHRSLYNSQNYRTSLAFTRNRIQTSQFHSTSRMLEKETSFYNKIVSLVSSVQGNPTKILDTLKQIASEGDVNKVKSFLHQMEGTNEFYQTDEDGRNVLHHVAIQGREDFIPLLEKNFDIDTPDKNGLTPLHWAIHEGHPETVRALIKRGASINYPWTAPDGCTLHPLAMAVAAGDPRVLEIFLENDCFQQIDFTQQISHVGNILHFAIERDQSNMLEYLLRNHHKKIDDLLEKKDRLGRTPLQLAAHLGNCDAIYLLDKQGVDLNKGEGEKHGTALHYAVRAKEFKAIEYLEKLGAELKAVDSEDQTPGALIRTLIKEQTSPAAEKCKALLSNRTRTKRVENTQRPNFRRRIPHNLVFQGGGPKGIAYVGALQQMENMKDEDIFSQLKRIAGTSAGSITAALISLGYRSEEVKKALFDLDFETLLDTKGELHKNLLDLGQDPSAKKGLKTILTEYWSNLKNNSFRPVKSAEALVEKLSALTGLCDGEKLREEVDKLIYQKTDIRYCTFKELYNLTRSEPEKYKELHVFATRLHKWKNSESIHFSHEDEKWYDLIISDAIRASASIPGVFIPHVLHFKDVTGERHSRPHHGQFVDGGLLKNYPLEAFDNNRYQEDRHTYGKKTNRRTLGFSLKECKPPTSEELQLIESPRELAQAVALTYFHAQEILQQEQEFRDRTVTIPVPEGIGMLTFKLTNEQKEELITSGAKSVDFFFNLSR